MANTASTKPGKVAKKASKRAIGQKRPAVVIRRPSSPEETRKAFGINARRWKDIEELVDEVVG